MTKKIKVRDKQTGKFWNGDPRWSKFNEAGKLWRTKETAEQAVAALIKYGRTFSLTNVAKLPDNWEFVEVEIKEVETSTSPIGDFLWHAAVREQFSKEVTHSWTGTNFYDIMRKKGVIDKIEFVIELNPREGMSYFDQSSMIQARAHLRGIGVKTRTFREYDNMIGMMDRDQAMKARLTLESVNRIIDLSKIRDSISAVMPKPASVAK